MKMAVDLGNSNIKMVTKSDDGSYVMQTIRSLATDDGFDEYNTVKLTGNKLYFGTGISLTSGKKTERKFVRETIALSAFKLFGDACNNEKIDLAVGLPLDLYKSNEKDAYVSKLEKTLIGTPITGTVEGELISTEIASVSVMAEGHSVFSAIEESVESDSFVIVDFGHGTTDVVGFTKTRSGWKVDGHKTINKGFKNVYEKIQREHLNVEGTNYTIEQLEDDLINDISLISRKTKQRYKLSDYMYAGKDVIDYVFTSVKDLFAGNYDQREVYVVGSGAHLLEGFVPFSNIVILDEVTSMYANVIGYYEQLNTK